MRTLKPGNPAWLFMREGVDSPDKHWQDGKRPPSKLLVLPFISALFLVLSVSFGSKKHKMRGRGGGGSLQVFHLSK